MCQLNSAGQKNKEEQYAAERSARGCTMGSQEVMEEKKNEYAADKSARVCKVKMEWLGSVPLGGQVPSSRKLPS